MAGIFFSFYKVVKSTWIQVEFHLIYTTATVIPLDGYNYLVDNYFTT